MAVLLPIIGSAWLVYAVFSIVLNTHEFCGTNSLLQACEFHPLKV